MVVGEDGALALPWLAAPLAQALAAQRGHALLVHASPGVGALQFALTLAQAWLCEARDLAKPCGRCASCRLIGSHLHPDLVVLLPETLRRAHGWPLDGDKAEGTESKRKPSRQIRIDEVRGLIDWSTKTSARGRGKVALVHPAEALNVSSASALLKTLEEPPAGTRIVLTAAEPAQLLATVRSRCQTLRLKNPPIEAAAAWLAGQGIEQAPVLLAACSGRPLDALALAQAGIDADAWSALPAAVASGQAGAMAGWSVPRTVDALQKLCHDALCLANSADTCFFPARCVPRHGSAVDLAAWWQTLARVARHDDHPWHEGLLIESLVQQGARALSPVASRADRATDSPQPAHPSRSTLLATAPHSAAQRQGVDTLRR